MNIENKNLAVICAAAGVALITYSFDVDGAETLYKIHTYSEFRNNTCKYWEAYETGTVEIGLEAIYAACQRHQFISSVTGGPACHISYGHRHYYDMNKVPVWGALTMKFELSLSGGEDQFRSDLVRFLGSEIENPLRHQGGCAYDHTGEYECAGLGVFGAGLSDFESVSCYKAPPPSSSCSTPESVTISLTGTPGVEMAGTALLRVTCTSMPIPPIRVAVSLADSSFDAGGRASFSNGDVMVVKLCSGGACQGNAGSFDYSQFPLSLDVRYSTDLVETINRPGTVKFTFD